MSNKIRIIQQNFTKTIDISEVTRGGHLPNIVFLIL